jgi:glycosyltransferase involved in cell wall biosynthesis
MITFAKLPKVDIILPTYNGARYLKRSIDSCLTQTYKNVDLVIVDDGSTDETPEIIRSYKDERIKYIRHRKNAGLPNALNTGFANSHGDYLTWTSDDNQYLPTAIEEMVSFLTTNKDIDMVYSDYWTLNLETKEKSLTLMPDFFKISTENKFGPCFLYSRNVYETLGGYNPNYLLVEDYDYWIRICKRFKVAHYSKPLYIFGEHSGSLSSTKYYSVRLLENLLQYRNGFISITEFQNSLRPPMSPKRLFGYLKSVVEVSKLSLKSCLLIFALLARLTLSLIPTGKLQRKVYYSITK